MKNKLTGKNELWKTTPGDWKLKKMGYNIPLEVQDENGNVICFIPVCGDTEEETKEMYANACLIYSSKNLLDVSEKLMKHLEYLVGTHEFNTNENINALRDAIKKARGEEHAT